MSAYDTRCQLQSSILDSSVAHILRLFLLNDIRSSVSSSASYCYGVCVIDTRLLHASDTDNHQGICLMSTAGCTSYQGLYVQRFFLGALESGVSPGWMLVVGGQSSILCKALTRRFSLTYTYRMVQETRASIPDGSLVQHDREILL